jgi:glutamyl-tRNA synthetase
MVSAAPGQADSIERPMRVRFAPSPTGALHIGGARTALFNWLLARGRGGTLVLRIEDTDRERSTPENVEQILDALRWLELDWDEGPIFQTERSERHQEALAALLASGHAYRSGATADDVKAYKQLHGADRGFRGEAETQGAVRLRVPDGGATVVHDVIRGDTRFEHVHLDDPVIARADGSVLYNFAVAIDDLDAQITHVVRGEDHLSNTPKQLLVLEAARAAGFDADVEAPVYAHLPLLHGPDGKKLSKRHGAASVQELRAAGYMPEAVRNYLALLGWGAGDDATVMSTEQLLERFALERVSHNPAQFDEAKLRWLNGVYIRNLSPAALARRLEEYTGRDGLEQAARISQEKIQTLADFWPLAGPLLDGTRDDPAARARWLDDGGRQALGQVRSALSETASFDDAAVQDVLEAVIAERGAKPREVYQPLRVALTGTTISPGIFESVALLGREETLRRIDAALASDD